MAGTHVSHGWRSSSTNLFTLINSCKQIYITQWIFISVTVSKKSPVQIVYIAIVVCDVNDVRYYLPCSAGWNPSVCGWDECCAGLQWCSAVALWTDWVQGVCMCLSVFVYSLYVCFSVCLYVCLSVHLYVCFCQYICVCQSLSMCMYYAYIWAVYIRGVRLSR